MNLKVNIKIQALQNDRDWASEQDFEASLSESLRGAEDIDDAGVSPAPLHGQSPLASIETKSFKCTTPRVISGGPNVRQPATSRAEAAASGRLQDLAMPRDKADKRKAWVQVCGAFVHWVD